MSKIITKPLVVNLYRVTNTIYMEILYQRYRYEQFNPFDPIYLKRKEYKCSNGIMLASYAYPEIGRTGIYNLYFRGSHDDRDHDLVSRIVGSLEEAIEYEYKFNEAIKEYNQAIMKWEAAKDWTENTITELSGRNQ